MKNNKLIKKEDSFDSVYKNIKQLLDEARTAVSRVVNSTLVQTYWEIGRIIIQEEQNGKEKAGYGTYLIEELSKKLIAEYGKGFSKRNIFNMRKFYVTFPIVQALSAQLTWSHFLLLINLEKKDARDFYLNESINSNWSTRELDRQINSLLYERLALSKDKKKVLELSQKGNIIEKPQDLIKEPYVLEFLGLKENNNYQEKYIEKALINKLKLFLLELGKGFSFVSRQKRINVGDDNFYIDLVFYNYILKCFVLVDLKLGKLTHQDIGQMDFYVRYFEQEEKQENDNPTVGIILCSDKNDIITKYTILNDNQNIFASKYKLYLPTQEELKKELNLITKESED